MQICRTKLESGRNRSKKIAGTINNFGEKSLGRTKKLSVTVSLLLLLGSGTGAFAQSSLSMPEMPVISVSSGPSIPSISSPAMGNSFHKPKISSTYKVVSATQSVSENISKSAEQTKNISAVKTTPQIKAAFASKNSVSAKEILAMTQGGLLSGNIYGLLNGVESNQLYASKQETNNTVLTTIISQLEEIKEKQENLERKVSYTTEKDGATFLRFTVNGEDILSSFRTVWFSSKENDGSFMVTGDRKYYEGTKLEEETFYLLFKADGNGGASMGYIVEPAIFQNHENKSSVLSKLASLKNLRATRTGNLVSLRTNLEGNTEDSVLFADILIDTGK